MKRSSVRLTTFDRSICSSRAARTSDRFADASIVPIGAAGRLVRHHESIPQSETRPVDRFRVDALSGRAAPDAWWSHRNPATAMQRSSSNLGARRTSEPAVTLRLTTV